MIVKVGHFSKNGRQKNAWKAQTQKVNTMWAVLCSPTEWKMSCVIWAARSWSGLTLARAVDKPNQQKPAVQSANIVCVFTCLSVCLFFSLSLFLFLSDSSSVIFFTFTELDFALAFSFSLARFFCKSSRFGGGGGSNSNRLFFAFSQKLKKEKVNWIKLLVVCCTVWNFYWEKVKITQIFLC